MRSIHETSMVEVLAHGRRPHGPNSEIDIWIQVNMSQVDVDDIFRIRKPDGALFKNEEGETVWVATATPHIPCVPSHRK